MDSGANEIRQRVLDTYAPAYREYGRSPGALLIPKGRQADRFTALTRWMNGADFSVLDFGCGFGDLKPFLDARFTGVRYTGVDLNADFIRECSEAHGAAADFRSISSFLDVKEEFDYVVISGAFNMLYLDAAEKHWLIARQILAHLFAFTRRILSFDCMTDQVDFKAPSAFHLSPIEAYAFASTHLSRRVVLDQSYMPYEFTTTVFNDAEIVRPENVYRPA